MRSKPLLEKTGKSDLIENDVGTFKGSLGSKKILATAAGNCSEKQSFEVSSLMITLAISPHQNHCWIPGSIVRRGRLRPFIQTWDN